MSILKVKNTTTGEWEEILAIVGPTGPAGPQGQEGTQGKTGPAGKNAYQYAQESGYTGTEEEFANKLAKNNILYVDFTDNGDGTYQVSKNVVEVQTAHAAGIDIKARITYDNKPFIVPIFVIGETFVGYGGVSENMTIYILHQGVTAQVSIQELALQADVDATLNVINEISSLLGNQIPQIDNANTGQVLSVSSIDENNAPSGWQAIDLPSGGGDTLEFIKTVTLTEEVSIVKINTDADGNPLNLKRFVVAIQTVGGTANTDKTDYLVWPNATAAEAITVRLDNGIYAAGAKVSSMVDMTLLKPGNFFWQVATNDNPKFNWGAWGNAESITEINFKTATDGYTFGVNTIFHIMGVKA